MFEVHHFPSRSVHNPTTKYGSIFAEFILALIREKIVTSGFPSHIVTKTTPEIYFSLGSRKHFGHGVYSDKISDNPGARYAAKIAANAAWIR